MKLLLKDPAFFFNYYIRWSLLNAYKRIFRKIKGKNINIRKYFGKEIKSIDCCNEEIKKLILSNEPFMVARFGSNELMFTGFSYLHNLDCLKDIDITNWNHDINCCGLFPNDLSTVVKFGNLMMDSIKSLDILCVWYNVAEDFFCHKFGSPDVNLTNLSVLDFWNFDEPWTMALKGKKVLVIHPYAELIESQYKNKDKVFGEDKVLPDFELKTLKAVQTIAGTKDERFDTWFDALDYMYNESLKIDFDIAIIGCGAYGFPLAAKIKNSGKQVIHMGGVTQMLFGILGKRWETEYHVPCINEYWVRPGEDFKPKNSDSVEDGCYW